MFIRMTKDKIYIELDNPDQVLVINWDVDLKPTSEHSSLRFFGESIIDHVHVYTTQFTEAQIRAGNTETVTTFGVNTDYLGRFENSLEAGNLDIGEPIVSWRLRRRDVGAGTTRIIAQTLPKSQLEFVDFFARNGETYEYSIFAVTANGEGLGQVSSEVSVDFFGVILTDGTTSFKFDQGFGSLDTSSIETIKDYTKFETNAQFPVFVYATRREYKEGSVTAIPYRLLEETCERITDRTTLETLIDFIENETEKTYKNTAGELYQVNTFNFSHNYPDEIDLRIHEASFSFSQTGEET